MHYILSGSFRSLALYILAFNTESPSNPRLDLVRKVDGNGPHQYIGLSPNLSEARRRAVYTTTWESPPSLSSWIYDRETQELTRTSTVGITATSSYVSLPPPYTHLYSAGGPSGEVHSVTPSDGAIVPVKLQEFLYTDDIDKADKTRVALRYGSHAIEIQSGRAFVPVLGTSTVEMYRVLGDGRLEHLSSNKSKRERDGPRHLVPRGDKLYVVSEHTNILDIYIIHDSRIEFHSSRSLLPPHLRSDDILHHYRGDTLSLYGNFVFATTRGADSSTRGWLSSFELDSSGSFVNGDDNSEMYWETPTSGGKANAISILPAQSSSNTSPDLDVPYPPTYISTNVSTSQTPSNINVTTATSSDGAYILLTDDCAGLPPDTPSTQCGPAVRVLKWDAKRNEIAGIVAEWPREGEEANADVRGGSHAVWLD